MFGASGLCRSIEAAAAIVGIGAFGGGFNLVIGLDVPCLRLLSFGLCAGSTKYKAVVTEDSVLLNHAPKARKLFVRRYPIA